jgi:hypothetical protein
LTNNSRHTNVQSKVKQDFFVNINTFTYTPLCITIEENGRRNHVVPTPLSGIRWTGDDGDDDDTYTRRKHLDPSRHVHAHTYVLNGDRTYDLLSNRQIFRPLRQVSRRNLLRYPELSIIICNNLPQLDVI